MELETIKFIKEHSNWKDLLTTSPYRLFIVEDEYYYLLKYNMEESDFTNSIVKECRGLIIDKLTLNPIALSFKKFHNIQEPIHDEIDWASAKVQEKIDGSKILCFFNKYTNKWQLSTSGNLNAYEANVNDFGITFGSLFERALINNSLNKNDFELLLHENYCYTFELVSPESKIVVSYPQPDLYFIGMRNINTFEEVSPNGYHYLHTIKKPKEYNLKTLDECLTATSKMDCNQEGFVVVDKDWNRIKIKSPAYVYAHFLRQNDGISFKNILRLIDQNQQDDCLAIFPEYKPYFDEVLNKKIKYITNLKNAFNNFLNNFSNENNHLYTRKDYAIYIINNYKNISNFLFDCINANCFEINFSIDDFIPNWWKSIEDNKKVDILKSID